MRRRSRRCASRAACSRTTAQPLATGAGRMPVATSAHAWIPFEDAHADAHRVSLPSCCCCCMQLLCRVFGGLCTLHRVCMTICLHYIDELMCAAGYISLVAILCMSLMRSLVCTSTFHTQALCLDFLSVHSYYWHTCRLQRRWTDMHRYR